MEEIIEKIKEACQEEISRKRDNFCAELYNRGFDPSMVQIKESFEIDPETNQLIYSCYAINRQTGETIKEDDVPPEQIELWENKEFLSWFNDQTEEVQKIVKKYPPNKTYCDAVVKEGEVQQFYQLYSYDQQETRVTLTVVRLSDRMVIADFDPDQLKEAKNETAKQG